MDCDIISDRHVRKKIGLVQKKFLTLPHQYFEQQFFFSRSSSLFRSSLFLLLVGLLGEVSVVPCHWAPGQMIWRRPVMSLLCSRDDGMCHTDGYANEQCEEWEEVTVNIGSDRRRGEDVGRHEHQQWWRIACTPRLLLCDQENERFVFEGDVGRR